LYPADIARTQPADKGLADFAAVALPTPDGETLNAWWKPPAAGKGVVLYLHGQSGNLGRSYIVSRLRDMADLGVGVLAVDYRGYGGSSGIPSEPGLTTDADTAYAYIKGAAPDAKIAVFGTSLGTGVAVALAAEHAVAGVMLDSPFASTLRIAQLRYPWLPIGAMMNDHWDSELRIPKIKVPVLIAHCDADTTVPLTEGQRLFAAANEPKAMIVLPGCKHIEIWNGETKSRILQTFRDWLT
jgi:fermentation-respiration switch protein FrsA (DUF1100 family)